MRSDLNPQSITIPVAGKSQFLSITSDRVIKQSTTRELNFYQNHAAHFQDIVPEVIAIDPSKSCLELRNITYGMRAPKIIDVKIGDFCSNEYYLRHYKGLTGKPLEDKITKRTTQSKHNGFSSNHYLIAGYSGQNTAQTKQERKMEIMKKTQKHIMNEFFTHQDAAQKAAQLLQSIRSTLSAPLLNTYAFISSSALIAFDEKNPKNVVVKIIDFTNFISLQKEDPEPKKALVKEFHAVFLKGLSNLARELAAVKHEGKIIPPHHDTDKRQIVQHP